METLRCSITACKYECLCHSPSSRHAAWSSLDVWITGEWLIAWEINSSFSVSFSPSQIKSGGWGAQNGSFCSLSEGMMALFLLLQVRAHERPQISFIQSHLGSQHKNTDVHDNGNGDNQKDSEHALWDLVFVGQHSNLFTDILPESIRQIL